MNKALIIGVGGFVGPYLVKELADNGYEVFGMDNKLDLIIPGLKNYFECDLLNKDQLTEIIKLIEPSHIINLAAISSVGLSWKIPQKTIEINVNGTLNVFESCISIGIRPKILLIGSSEEYKESNRPLSENDPIDASNPYGISKVAQEQLAKIYRDRYNWEIYCVRSFNHIGVGQNHNFVISSWCKQVAEIEKGLKKPVLYVGNISVSRDISDVRDVTHAYRLVLEKGGPNEIYNVGSGHSYPLKTILEFIISLSSKHIDYKVDPNLLRPNDNPYICCNNSKITKELNFSFKYDIFKTIKSIYGGFLE